MSNRKILVVIAAVFILAASATVAQEVCFTDAKKEFESWRAVHGRTLDELSERYEASSDPYREMITYNGMQMPIAAALIIEGEKYGKEADVKVGQTVNDAQACSKETQTVRGTYDFAREILGITTILPEKATRIDFEELRRGNIAGGKESVIRDTGRRIDEVLNPFRW